MSETADPNGAAAAPAPAANGWWRHGLAALVVAIGSALTLYVSSELHELGDARGADRFRNDARALTNRIEARMQAHESILAAGAGLFEASDRVDRQEWKRFVDSVRLAERFPGLLGFGYSMRVPEGRLERVVAEMGRERDGEFRAWPESTQGERHVIVYVEPENPRNLRALGYDMGTEPVRRAAMRAAAASEQTAMSGVVRLVQEGGDGLSQPGFLLFRPVYARGRSHASPAERQAALAGFVYEAFRAHDLVNAIVGDDPPEFNFRLIDRGGIDGHDEVLFERTVGAVSEGGERLVETHAFSFGGRLWAVEASAPHGFGAGERALQESALVAVGLTLSIVLGIMTLVMARTRERAVNLAAAMTRDLEASQRRFERMVAGSSDGVWEFDPRSRRVYLSPRFMELLGYPAQEIRHTNRWVARRIHRDDRRKALEAFGALTRHGGIFDTRLRMCRADGEYRWYRVRGRAFADERGGNTLASGSLSDVHEDYEARLRESRLLRIIELSPDMFMTFDLEGRPTYQNPAARRVFGEIGAGRLSGASVASVFAQNEVDRVFNEGVPTAYMQDYWDGETELITIDGEVMPVSQVILSHKTETGQVEFYSTVMRDISALRSALEDLKRTRERLQNALDGANDGIWERNLETGEMFTSDRLAEMLGYDRASMVKTVEQWQALVHPDDRGISQGGIARLLASDESVEWDTRMRTGSGEYRWMRRRGRAVRDARGKVVTTAGTLSDIHDAKMADQALRDLQARYQRVLDGSNDGIWEMEELRDEYFASARYCEILGWNPGEAPRNRAELRELIHPDDLAMHLEHLKRMHESTDAHSWDVRMRRNDGTYHWVRFRGIAIRDDAGRVSLCSGTVSDVNEAKLAEQELHRHRDNLAQLVEERTAGLEIARRDADAQRVHAEASREAAERASMAKSEFLANMSHELRTPMHAIISFANFGVDRHERAERDKLLHYFRNIQKSGSRLLTLLNDLLDLSKLEAGKMQMQLAPLQPGALVAEAVGESEAFAQGRGVRLRVTASADTGEVRWDGARLMQVLRNLISNAVKFSPGGGEVIIELRRVRVRTGRRADDPVVDGVEIRVRDAGIGIPEGELETVFDKFVQSSKTKTGAGGTGLGLAICREIVLAQFGTIHAENNPAPACGATFVVRLPVDPDGARIRRNEPVEVAE